MEQKQKNFDNLIFEFFESIDEIKDNYAITDKHYLDFIDSLNKIKTFGNNLIENNKVENNACRCCLLVFLNASNEFLSDNFNRNISLSTLECYQNKNNIINCYYFSFVCNVFPILPYYIFLPYQHRKFYDVNNFVEKGYFNIITQNYLFTDSNLVLNDRDYLIWVRVIIYLLKIQEEYLCDIVGDDSFSLILYKLFILKFSTNIFKLNHPDLENNRVLYELFDVFFNNSFQTLNQQFKDYQSIFEKIYILLNTNYENMKLFLNVSRLRLQIIKLRLSLTFE